MPGDFDRIRGITVETVSFYKSPIGNSPLLWYAFCDMQVYYFMVITIGPAIHDRSRIYSR